MMMMRNTLKGLGAAFALAFVSAAGIGTATAQAQTGGYLPSFHGASAGFTDLSSLAANGSDGQTSSILLNNQVEEGLVTFDPRTGLFTHVELDVSTSTGGVIGGIATVTVSDGFNTLETRQVPARGAIRFRENWRRNYQPGLSEEALGLDGVLRRQIGHVVRIQAAGPSQARVALRGQTRFDTDSRFDIASFGARLQTQVARQGQPNVGGRSDVVISGLEDEAFYFEVNQDDFRPLNPRNNAWTASTLAYSPFNRGDISNEFEPITPVSADLRVQTRFYDTLRDRPGRYAFNYRAQNQRDAYRLQQQGWLLATLEDEGAEALAGNLSPFVNSLFDASFNAASRQANTRIVSNRDQSLLKRN